MVLMLMLSYMAHLSNKKTQEGQIAVVRLMDGWMDEICVCLDFHSRSRRICRQPDIRLEQQQQVSGRLASEED